MPSSTKRSMCRTHSVQGPIDCEWRSSTHARISRQCGLPSKAAIPTVGMRWGRLLFHRARLDDISLESGVGSLESGVWSRESGVGSRESRIGRRKHDSLTPDSRLPTPDSRLPTPDFHGGSQLLIQVSFAFAFLFSTAAGLPAQSPVKASIVDSVYPVIIDDGVRVKMRDGVSLVADIYRPNGEGKFPVLLERTPYDRKGESDMAYQMAAHGYVVVLQDTRGRYDSGGEFYPFRNESQDGFDTVEWAAQLKYADGKVGMFGGSYVGATQMLAAMEHPPHLLAIFPYVTGSDYYDGWTYQNGVLMQWFSSSWTSILAVETLRRRANENLRPKEWVTTLPVENYQVLSLPPFSDLAPYFHDWIEHERSDAYWKQWRVSDHYGEMNVKGLHAAGWHDLFLKGSIKNYTGLHAQD